MGFTIKFEPYRRVRDLARANSRVPQIRAAANPINAKANNVIVVPLSGVWIM